MCVGYASADTTQDHASTVKRSVLDARGFSAWQFSSQTIRRDEERLETRAPLVGADIGLMAGEESWKLDVGIGAGEAWLRVDESAPYADSGSARAADSVLLGTASVARRVGGALWAGVGVDAAIALSRDSLQTLAHPQCYRYLDENHLGGFAGVICEMKTFGPKCMPVPPESLCVENLALSRCPAPIADLSQCVSQLWSHGVQGNACAPDGVCSRFHGTEGCSETILGRRYPLEVDAGPWECPILVNPIPGQHVPGDCLSPE